MNEEPLTRRAPASRSAIDARFRVARILWASLLGSVFLYVLMLVQVRSNAQASAFDPTLAMALAPVALVLAVASVVVPRRVLHVALKASALAVTNEPGEMIGSFRESAPMRRVVAEPEHAVVAAFPRFQTTFILGMALAEAIAILGVMIGFLGAPPAVCAPFFLVTIGLMATKFPRLATLTGAIERATGARCVLKV